MRICKCVCIYICIFICVSCVYVYIFKCICEAETGIQTIGIYIYTHTYLPTEVHDMTYMQTHMLTYTSIHPLLPPSVDPSIHQFCHPSIQPARLCTYAHTCIPTCTCSSSICLSTVCGPGGGWTPIPPVPRLLGRGGQDQMKKPGCDSGKWQQVLTIILRSAADSC